MSGPAGDARDSLHVGSSFGAYRIEALLGAGGMGRVYRALDLKLGRRVAIKVLPAAVNNDPERLARLSREARVLAALNHPNIAAIFGLEEVDGVRGLILEFVEGTTLTERLATGPIPLRTALVLARQIADATEAAHDKGIVHRDLKPANIVITPSSIVKVLDFGLAKATALDADNPDGSAVTVTTAGTVVGSAGYMSPEQARGHPVNEQTDIWAFGCVLYEMLSGKRAFGGSTLSDSVAKILEREPDWSALPADVPVPIRRLLIRCLEKQPGNRIHDIADARIELVDALAAKPEPASSPAPRRRTRRAWVAALVVLIASVAAIAIAILLNTRGITALPLVEFSLTLPDGRVPGFGMAVSPDERRIALAAFGPGPEIWLRSLDSSDVRALPGTRGGNWPFWSPDGGSLAFFADGKLKRADLAAGSVITLCDAASARGGSWSTSNDILFSADGKLYRVAASGGTPTLLNVVDDAGVDTDRTFPVFFRGDRFIYFATGRGGGAAYAASIAQGTATRLIEADYPATYAAPGQLLTVRGTELSAHAFDEESLTIDGPAVPLAASVAPGFLTGHPSVSASASVLAFSTTRLGQSGRLQWFDRAGQPGSVIEQPQGVDYLNPVIAPTGNHVAVNRMDPTTGNWDVWIIDVARNISSPLTVGPSPDADPVWSSNERQVVFGTVRDGRPALFRANVGTPGSEERLLDIDVRNATAVPTDWTHDGRFVVYTLMTRPPTGNADVWVLPLDGARKPFPLLPKAQPGRYGTYGARTSPDGRWIAYASDDGGLGRWEIYVQPFMTPGPRYQVSRGGGTHPRWTSNGNEIVYWAASFDRLMSVPIDFKGGIRVGTPIVLLAAHIPGLLDGRTHYDITRDGRRLLVRQPIGSGGSPATVILNWREKLKTTSAGPR